MNGVQYYWTIAVGLLVGLCLCLVIGFSGGFQTSDPLVVIPITAAFLYASVAIFVVLLEIWDRFGLGAAVLAAIIAPAIIVYWFMRIGGIPKDR